MGSDQVQREMAESGDQFGLGRLGWVKVGLSIYSLSTLTSVHFLSIAKNGSYALMEERYLILACWLLLLEILNQATFFWAKADYHRAVLLRGLAFWGLYSVAIVVYSAYLVALPTVSDAEWHKNLFLLLVYSYLSVAMAHYSLVPDFRFLLLRGRLTQRKRG